MNASSVDVLTFALLIMLAAVALLVVLSVGATFWQLYRDRKDRRDNP
jgi:heme/copper-type cytochrome/quinol oxidase subunit 2